MKRILAAALIGLLTWPQISVAQSVQATPAGATVISTCNGASIYTVGTTPPMTQDPKGNSCASVFGSFSATLSGFTPNSGSPVNRSVTTSSQNVALPAGAVVLVQNDGANEAFVNLGTSNSVTATTDNIGVPSGGGCALTVGSNTWIAAITATSTSTLKMNGGSGLANTCWGGGSSGGGSGGNVNLTQVGGSSIALGSTTSSASLPVVIASDQAAVAVKQATAANLNATVVGTGTLAVQNTAATPAGTNLIGKVGIDQTTPGTTNGVQVNAALPAGTNVIGHVIADTGSTTAVTQAAAANLNATVVGTGTFATQAAQSGTWNITNVSGTVSLPTGAATAAKQPALGTAGSPSADVLTVQGSASGTAIPVTSGVAQGSTTAGQTLSPVGMATSASALTYTTAQTNIPWLRTNGAQAQDLASINGTTVSTGTGAQGTGTPRVTVATDTATIAGSAPGTAGSASANVVTVQGVTSMTPVQVSQATAANLNATVVGTGTFAAQAAQSGTWTVQIGNTPNTTPILEQAVPGTANGLTFATVTAANSTNATNLKASAGQLYHITAYNNSATLAWISFYNTSGTPTCGTSIVYQVMIPANSTSGAGAIDDIPSGLAFSTGIGYCITTGIAGTGSVAASSYVVNFGYK